MQPDTMSSPSTEEFTSPCKQTDRINTSTAAPGPAAVKRRSILRQERVDASGRQRRHCLAWSAYEPSLPGQSVEPEKDHHSVDKCPVLTSDKGFNFGSVSEQRAEFYSSNVNSNTHAVKESNFMTSRDSADAQIQQLPGGERTELTSVGDDCNTTHATSTTPSSGFSCSGSVPKNCASTNVVKTASTRESRSCEDIMTSVVEIVGIKEDFGQSGHELEDNKSTVYPTEASPSLRVRSLRKSSSRRKRMDGSKSASPSPVASPVLSIHRLNASENGSEDSISNGDDGSGDDDEDDGVYDETFRYSSYKYLGDKNDTAFDESSDGKGSIDFKSIDKHPDGRVGTSCSESILYNCSEKKNHQRSLSMTTAEIKRNNGVDSKTLSRKVIKRHVSMGAETYQAASDRIYDVERTLILQKLDSVPGYGFHLLGQYPMIISTVEPGSAAELGGVQIGDRLVTINGTNVLKAKDSIVIQLVAQSPSRLELGVASGTLSRDICLCSGYIYLKKEGIMKNWKRRWCQLKYDGFLYYYRSEECIDPMGAISLSNYVIIRGADCVRSCMFKLVKYGQKTYYVQTETEDDMNRWANNINVATSIANTLTDHWLDISSHNVRLPALSIKNPDCHGFLTKIGYRKKNWRRRYCVLKTACLYYYKDQTSSTAKGVVHLHGYTVEEENVYHRRFGFMVVPPMPQMRTFHFTADNETDMQRFVPKT